MIGSEAVGAQDDVAAMVQEQLYVGKLSADIQVGIGAEAEINIGDAPGCCCYTGSGFAVVPPARPPLEVVLSCIHVVYQE